MFKETPLGFEYATKKYLVFFGKKNCKIIDLKTAYPKLTFRQIKQTHSDILIKSKIGSETIEADAHWTNQKNVALVVRTADCMPILAYSEKADLVLAVHAGWRGVQNKILAQAIKKLSLNDQLKIYVGPHIQKNSFEVDQDVKDLLAAQPANYIKNENKYYIDLKNILYEQIDQVTENSEKFLLNKDTMTDSSFNSFRRQKKSSERNLNFIVKI